MTSCRQRRTHGHRHASPLRFLRPGLKSAGELPEFSRREHSLDINLRSFILEMYMQVKGGATDSLDLSGTGSCAAFNFRRTARAVTRLYDLGLEPSGLRATQFAILTANAKFLAEMGGDTWPGLRNELERLAGMAVQLETLALKGTAAAAASKKDNG